MFKTMGAIKRFIEVLVRLCQVQYREISGLSLFLPKETIFSLAGVAQWIEHWPVNRKVTGSIPSQGTGLLAGGPSERQPCMSLTLMFLSLSFSLPHRTSKKVNK